MIDYGSFIFAAAPKTGTTWFLKVAEKSGLARGSKSHVHTKAPEDVKKMSVSLVRHPCDWLASYYYTLKGGATGVLEADALVDIARGNYEFEDFVHEYLKEFPGQISYIFYSYNADSYIRTCDLQWAAYELFVLNGADPRKAAAAVALGHRNVGKYEVMWSPILWRKVVDSEEICSEFDFE